jgi:hypothetical protein
VILRCFEILSGRKLVFVLFIRGVFIETQFPEEVKEAVTAHFEMLLGQLSVLSDEKHEKC